MLIQEYIELVTNDNSAVVAISKKDYPYDLNDMEAESISYQVTLISRDPDEETRDKIAMLPMCRYERQFKTEDMNHDIFRIYI